MTASETIQKLVEKLIAHQQICADEFYKDVANNCNFSNDETEDMAEARYELTEAKREVDMLFARTK